MAGGDATANAVKIRAILAGHQGASRDIVILNTGAALVVAGVAPDLKDGVRQARTALESGAAQKKLAELAAFRS